MPIILTSHGSSEAAPATSSAHDGAVPPNRAADWRSFTGQPLAEFTAVDLHPGIAKSHTRPRRLTLSAAIEDVHPQCGRELCARARVNMGGTQEPRESSDDGFPRCRGHQ